MAKRQRNRAKKSHAKETIRKRPPLLSKKNGNLLAECPFCPERHPVDLAAPAYCGTQLELVAVQTISAGKKLKCILCGEFGGTMVKVGDAYRHAHACSPGKVMYDHHGGPKKSFFARLAWKLPDSALRFIANRTGKTPVELSYQDPKTGEKVAISGYGWQRITQ